MRFTQLPQGGEHIAVVVEAAGVDRSASYKLCLAHASNALGGADGGGALPTHVPLVPVRTRQHKDDLRRAVGTHEPGGAQVASKVDKSARAPTISAASSPAAVAAPPALASPSPASRSTYHGRKFKQGDSERVADEFVAGVTNAKSTNTVYRSPKKEKRDALPVAAAVAATDISKPPSLLKDATAAGEEEEWQSHRGSHHH